MTDYEAIEKALRRKASSPMECPVCGEDSWGLPEVRLGLIPLDTPVDEVTREAPNEPETGTEGFWPITCLNCGFVRLFHVETLLDH